MSTIREETCNTGDPAGTRDPALADVQLAHRTAHPSSTQADANTGPNTDTHIDITASGDAHPGQPVDIEALHLNEHDNIQTPKDPVHDDYASVMGSMISPKTTESPRRASGRGERASGSGVKDDIAPHGGSGASSGAGSGSRGDHDDEKQAGDYISSAGDCVDGGDGKDTDSEISKQDGVLKIEAVAMSWSIRSLVIAYLGIFLLACAISMEQQTTGPLLAFATSAFNSHSLVSTVTVVQQVVNAVVKPPIAKLSDVLGRLEAYILAIFLFILGYVLMASSRSVSTVVSAQIFYAAGGTGLQVLQQVFIADTTNLLNRALWSSLPDIPYLVTVWVGPLASQKLKEGGHWRWGFGLWTVVLPCAFLPFALSLYLNQRRAKHRGLLPPNPWSSLGPLAASKRFFWEIDGLGVFLLTAGFSLVLIPLTIASKQAKGWGENGWLIGMVVVGAACLVGFPFVEGRKALARHPLVPLGMLRNRTVVCGCVLGMWYFMAFYLSVFPYFYSYLLVVQNLSITHAGHITQIFSFSATITSVLVSLAIKYTRHYKYYIVSGTIIYILGLGLMVRYRNLHAGMGQIVGSQVCLGVGGGMINVSTQLGIQAAVGHQSVASATALFLTIVEIGGGIGAAISGAVWGKMIPKLLVKYLPEGSKHLSASIFNDLNVASTYPWGGPERDAINRAYQETMHRLLIIACCVAIPVLPLALGMQNIRLDRVEQQVKGRVIGGRIGADGTVRSAGWTWHRVLRGCGLRRESVAVLPVAGEGKAEVKEVHHAQCAGVTEVLVVPQGGSREESE